MNTRPDSAASDKGPLLLLSSRFSDWLASVDACLSLTTYQPGRLFFIGRKADGGVRAHERLIEQCEKGARLLFSQSANVGHECS